MADEPQQKDVKIPAPKEVSRREMVGDNGKGDDVRPFNRRRYYDNYDYMKCGTLLKELRPAGDDEPVPRDKNLRAEWICKRCGGNCSGAYAPCDHYGLLFEVDDMPGMEEGK